MSISVHTLGSGLVLPPCSFISTYVLLRQVVGLVGVAHWEADRPRDSWRARRDARGWASPWPVHPSSAGGTAAAMRMATSSLPSSIDRRVGRFERRREGALAPACWGTSGGCTVMRSRLEQEAAAAGCALARRPAGAASSGCVVMGARLEQEAVAAGSDEAGAWVRPAYKGVWWISGRTTDPRRHRPGCSSILRGEGSGVDHVACWSRPAWVHTWLSEARWSTWLAGLGLYTHGCAVRTWLSACYAFLNVHAPAVLHVCIRVCTCWIKGGLRVLGSRVVRAYKVADQF